MGKCFEEVMSEEDFWKLYNALNNTRKQLDEFDEVLRFHPSRLHDKKNKIYDLLGDLMQMLRDSPAAPACVKDDEEVEA